jgi:hypothetical protein
MYKMWKGLDPHVVLSVVGSFITICVLVIHVFAFKAVGYPKSAITKYNPPAAITK